MNCLFVIAVVMSAMCLIKSLVCCAVFTLANSRGTLPSFHFPQGNRWSRPVEYVRVPEPKSINCQAKATPPVKYYWIYKGANITWDKNIVSFSVDNGTLTTGAKFETQHSGEYQCVAYNNYGTLMTPALTILAAVHEQFLGKVETKTVEEFESKYVKLKCENVMENVPPPKFMWFRGTSKDQNDFVTFDLGHRMIIDHEGSLHFLWVEKDDSYFYSCATYNTVFFSTKRNPRTIKLEVKTGIVVDREPELKYEHDLEVFAGENAVLMCIFTYFSQMGHSLEIEWSHRGVLVHKGQTLTLNNVMLPSDTQNQEGEYLCEASLGSTKRFGRVNLKIVGPPTLLPGQAPETKFVPVGKDVVIDCKAKTHNSYSFPPVWFKNGNPLIGCPMYHFECKNRGQNGFPQCKPEGNVCDTFPDCTDGSDEMDCLGSCLESQQRCGDKCIDASSSCPDQACTYPKFECRNEQGCTTQDQICNGVTDCKDGSDEFACSEGVVTHVDRVFINSARTQLTLPNVRLQDMMCFQCMVRNDYGSVFGDACLTVIDRIRVLKQPNSTYFVEPGSRLEITVEATTDIMLQNQVKYTWMWYEVVTNTKTGEKTGTTSTETLPPSGSAAAFFHVSQNGKNMTILFPEVSEKDGDSYTVYNKLIDRHYTLVIKHKYDRVEFNFTITGRSITRPEPVVEAASTNLGFIAIIVGVLFLFVVIVLIIGNLYRNRGGTYPVDEKEQEAGNNPVEELNDGGLRDVGRVYDDIDENDTDRPKGDNVSLSGSVQPYDSEDDLTKEYGDDFDVSKFNEDGSFIGVYVDNKSSRTEVTA